MTEKLVAGIDIGGTNTVIGLVNEKGEVVYRETLLTTDYATPEDFVLAVCEKLLKGKGDDQSEIVAVGIGAPSGNVHTGCIENAPNLKWKGIVPLAELIQKKCGHPTVLTNDANAAAMGELEFGVAKGMKDVLYITLGTGVGSGIIADGKILYGHLGFAGELGHVIIEKNGRQCGCGRKGCLETYCSAPGMVITYHECGGDKNVSTAREVYERAMKNEKAALDTFEKTGAWLGFAIANCVAVTGPEAVILFGGPTAAGDILMKPLQKSMDENLLFLYRGKIKLLVSSLPSNDAAILGAASLVKLA